jgi:hypothetical protein
MLASTMQFSNTNQHTHHTNHLTPNPGDRFGSDKCLTFVLRSRNPTHNKIRVCCLRTQQCAKQYFMSSFLLSRKKRS